MIDEEKTFREMGYRSTDLSYGSGKKVWAEFKAYRDMCHGCAVRTDEYRAVMSERKNGKNLSPRTDEHGRNISEAKMGHSATAECRQNMSAAKLEFFSDPINCEKHSAALQGIPYDEWEGFATDKPYCPAFDGVCRESNRDKYDRQCFLCGLDESDNISSIDKHKKLSVHHVDMNKDQGCNGHTWKLVPLCMWCHSKAHGKLVMDRIIYLLENVWNT